MSAMQMERWHNKVAFVTGASSGIGAALVERLVQVGIQVVAVARRIDRLKDLAKSLENEEGKIYPYQADLGNEDELHKALQWTQDNLGPIHILVNNAAILKGGHITSRSNDDLRQMLDVNVLALVIASKEVIKIMKNNRIDGHIININSIAGQNLPSNGTRAFYGATKYAITALTEGLRQELNELGTKIKISSISPGLVDTEMVTTNQELTEEMREAFAASPRLSPYAVADAILYVLGTPPDVQIHELVIKPVNEAINS